MHTMRLWKQNAPFVSVYIHWFSWKISKCKSLEDDIISTPATYELRGTVACKNMMVVPTFLKQLFNPLLLMQKRTTEGVRIRRGEGEEVINCWSMDVYVCKEERGHKTETVKVILIPGYTSLCSAPNERNRKHICGSLSCLLHHHYDSITIHLNLKCTMYNITDPLLLLLCWSKLHEKKTFLASTNKKRKFTSIFALY